MKAMRILGLAEEASRGFDRIWQSMLSTGRPAPLIEVSEDSFSIRISSRRPDSAFMRTIHALTTRASEELILGHSTLVVLWHLRDHDSISLDEAVRVLQTDELAAGDILEELEEFQLIVKNASAPSRRETWFLAPEVRRLYEEARAAEELRTGIGVPPIAHALDDPSPSSDDAANSPSEPSLRTYIESKLRAGQQVLAAEIARELQCERTTVTAVLSAMRKDGIARVDPDGPQRGPGARWVLTPETR